MVTEMFQQSKFSLPISRKWGGLFPSEKKFLGTEDVYLCPMAGDLIRQMTPVALKFAVDILQFLTGPICGLDYCALHSPIAAL